LAAAVVADANVWYSVSRGTNEGDYLGAGFFAVFAFGGFSRWRSGRDRFHLAAATGAAVALALIAIRDVYPFNWACLPSYVVFILACILGSLLSHRSKQRAGA
jgi:hypothetical protein